VSSRRGAAALIAAFALLLPVLAGCSKHEGKALPAPAPSGSTTSSTDPIDFTQVSIQPIALADKVSTTTTRPLGGGQASVAGRVLDDNGAPVPQAFIRATYYNDPAKPEIIEALSADDGTYRFDKVLGGRWRIRAWKTPTLATSEEATFFLGFTENKALDLKTKAARDLAVTSNIASNPPFIGQPAELAVLVMTEAVNDNGALVRTPVPDTVVTLYATGSWSFATDATQSTDSGGRAEWTLTCLAEGSQPISAIVTGREFPLNLPACMDPMSTSTTTPPPTESSSSTSTTKKKTSTTTTSTRPKSYATTSTRPRSAGHA